MIKDGVLNIYKPENMTSSQVVGAVRRILDVRKVGHTGTLDPMATGVLPVCIGKAARIMDYLNFDLKKYRCTLQFGFTTDTLDIWGEKLETYDCSNLTEKDVREAFNAFEGLIYQYPPMYSAVRIQGKHLYEYARKGVKPPVEPKKRKVYIEDLTIEDIDMADFRVTFTVSCSKGTYIRTICQDVGEALKVGATMLNLERIGTGALKVENSITLEELEKTKWENLLPTDSILVNFGKVIVNENVGFRFVDGWHISMKDILSLEEPKQVDENLLDFIDPKLLRAYRVYTGDIFLGVAYFSEKYHKLVADKVFYRRDDDENI
ncbi:MAG: tRNA pseudouridine(55) synthase TruB [Clostridia bacterium]|nr:tRNA pseudouridine(55) synthase TruB [Clostridia bacterium]